MQVRFCINVLLDKYPFSLKHFLVFFSVYSIANVSCVSADNTGVAVESEKNKEVVTQIERTSQTEIIPNRIQGNTGVDGYPAPNLKLGEQITFKDWEVTCDNLFDCRTAGYQPDSSGYEPASIMLFRPLKNKRNDFSGYVKLWTEDKECDSNEVTLRIGDKNLGELRKVDSAQIDDSHNRTSGVFKLSSAQLIAIRAEGSREHSGSLQNVSVDCGSFEWEVSLKGLSSSLAVVELLQSSIEETNVSAQKTFPKKITSTNDLTAKKLMRWSTYFEENCDLFEREGKKVKQLKLGESDYLLVVSPCWLAAYNIGSIAIRLSRDLESIVDEIDFNNKLEGEGYLRFRREHKSRGLGDCWYGNEIIWNGSGFVESERWHTGMCRGYGGGAWHFPQIITEVVAE